MRLSALLLLPLGLGPAVHAAAQAPPVACTGLCLQQVSCPGTTTTSISGVVYAPNGTDPLPDVTVYIPNAPVAAFTPGVSCPVVGAPPSGSPLLGTYTAFDGSFTLTDVPVGPNIPIVIQTGRWRRQVTVDVPATAACTNIPNVNISMPQNQTQGDIPKFAIVTGSADEVECVLLKVGISPSEFTDPSGSGRINFYLGTGSPGSRIDSATPSASVLMGNYGTLSGYDVLMLPCEGSAKYTGAPYKTAADLANLVTFANAGGRVYSSHYSYAWMNTNPPFNTVVNWDGNQADPTPDPGIATVDTSFSEGQTLSQWLVSVGADAAPGPPAQIGISTLRHDFDGVNAPTQSWLTLNDTKLNNPVMQFVFDTPVGNINNQCGRVLFNEYHVENPPSSPANVTFPAECPNSAMNAQEKLLEFSLFDLTGNGGQATLAPTTQDFGDEALSYTTAPQYFTWTNKSFFATGVTLLTAGGDFSIASSNCSSVPPGDSCQIGVVFTPTVLGSRTGTLTVGSAGTSLTASLTGTGVPAVSISTTALAFGNLDVGNTSAQSLTLTNNAPIALPIPTLNLTGDYSVTTNCANPIPSNSQCTATVVFHPSTTGPRPGTLTVVPNPATVTLTGNGVDFSLALSPTSGSVIAGLGTSTNLTITPLAGFIAPVSLACSTNATASTCIPGQPSFTPTSAVTTSVSLTTTSKYSVIGYTSLGGGGGGLLLLLGLVLGLASGCLLWMKRRKSPAFARAALFVLFMAAVGVSLTGCGGKLPAENPIFTAPGNYTFTLTVTDGFLVHSATYSLTVAAK